MFGQERTYHEGTWQLHFGMECGNAIITAVEAKAAHVLNEGVFCKSGLGECCRVAEKPEISAAKSDRLAVVISEVCRRRELLILDWCDDVIR
jgi:hypothetical protein